MDVNTRDEVTGSTMISVYILRIKSPSGYKPSLLSVKGAGQVFGPKTDKPEESHKQAASAVPLLDQWSALVSSTL